MNKNKPAVCCMFDLFKSGIGEDGEERGTSNANVMFIEIGIFFSMSFKCLSQSWDNVWKTALFYICNKLYKFLKCE